MSKRKLLDNTVFLYLLVFSNYFFSFITVPYQTRILGPEFYGKLGFATALTAYFQLIFDFGFMLSATAEVAQNKRNKRKINEIYTKVTYSKFVLIALSSCLLCIMLYFIPKLQEDPLLYILFFLSTAINSLLPDYLYRGLEDMRVLALRTMFVRLFFTIMIFFVLKESSDYYYIPLLNIIGSVGALIFVYYDVKNKLEIAFVSVKVVDVITTLRESSYFFLSRIATSIYDATNTFILGFLYPSGNILGYYTSANNLVKTARSSFSPIADSLYPYMIKNKDFKLIKKILIILMPMISAACIIIGIYSTEISVFLFGDQFVGAGLILQLLLPLIVLGLPNYILGFPTLTPLGLSHFANKSTIAGAVIQLCGLIILYIFGIMNVYSIIILSVITEFLVLLFRVIVIFKFTKRL